MGHVARTHRVNLDWLLERSIIDPCVYCRYIDTKTQIADLLAKPNFTVSDWCNLCSLFRLGAPPAATMTEHEFVSKLIATTTSSTVSSSTTSVRDRVRLWESRTAASSFVSSLSPEDLLQLRSVLHDTGG